MYLPQVDSHRHGDVKITCSDSGFVTGLARWSVLLAANFFCKCFDSVSDQKRDVPVFLRFTCPSVTTTPMVLTFSV